MVLVITLTGCNGGKKSVQISGLNNQEENIVWFGAYLNDGESEFRDKILTIAYIYDNCKQMGKRNNNKYTVDKMNTISRSVKKANDNIGGNVNIYKLTGEGSPFFDLQLHDIFRSNDTEAKSADFYQYIVCIKNSEATRPLNDEY